MREGNLNVFHKRFVSVKQYFNSSREDKSSNSSVLFYRSRNLKTIDTEMEN